MSDILNELGEFIDKFKQIYDYVENLENNQNAHNISYDVYEIEIQDVPEFYIYTPTVRYVEQPKCNKCNSNRLLPQINTVTNNFKMCECSRLLPIYECTSIPIYKIERLETGDILYTVKDNKSVIINGSFVLDTFIESNTFVNSQSIYYKNENDCRKYCNFMNKENSYEI